jgi:acyl carrier protein
MVPNKFMVIEKWPLTPNGKVDKNSLPVPEEDAFQKEYVAPKGNIELTLVSIWASLLNQEINKICVEDDFFDIGGHSLLMVRLKTEIGVAYGIDFKIKDLFELKSIREMSIVIGRELVKNQINEASIDEVEEVEF